MLGFYCLSKKLNNMFKRSAFISVSSSYFMCLWAEESAFVKVYKDMFSANGVWEQGTEEDIWA